MIIAGCGLWPLGFGLLAQRRCKLSGALTRAGDLSNPRRTIERCPTLDRWHSEIELEPFGLAGQRQPDRMKERFPFLPCFLAHARRRSTEGFSIDQWATCRELRGERVDHGAGAVRLVTDLRCLQRAFRRVVEKK